MGTMQNWAHVWLPVRNIIKIFLDIFVSLRSELVTSRPHENKLLFLTTKPLSSCKIHNDQLLLFVSLNDSNVLQNILTSSEYLMPPICFSSHIVICLEQVHQVFVMALYNLLFYPNYLSGIQLVIGICHVKYIIRIFRLRRYGSYPVVGHISPVPRLRCL